MLIIVAYSMVQGPNIIKILCDQQVFFLLIVSSLSFWKTRTKYSQHSTQLYCVSFGSDLDE